MILVVAVVAKSYCEKDIVSRDRSFGMHSALTSRPRTNLSLVLQHLSEIGYECSSHRLRACEYGVPQRRCRYYIIGLLRTADIFAEPMQEMHGNISRRIGWLKTSSGVPAGYLDLQNWEAMSNSDRVRVRVIVIRGMMAWYPQSSPSNCHQSWLAHQSQHMQHYKQYRGVFEIGIST